MKEIKQPARNTGKKAAQPKSNNMLLVVLAVLLLIIVALVIYAMSPGKAPSSLVEQSQQISRMEATNANQGESVTILPVATNQAAPAKTEPLASPVNNTAATPKSAERTAAKEYLHTVKAGETLFNITQRYNLPQQEFRDINNLRDNTLKIGQQVKVKITAIHLVQPSEGLKAIAEKYQVNKQLIIKANSLEDEKLQLNQQLIIPLP